MLRDFMMNRWLSTAIAAAQIRRDWKVTSRGALDR
jgi:hypothetical protein